MSHDLPAIALPRDLESGACACRDLPAAAGRGRLTAFRKPSTPDPFVNAQLTPVGVDAAGRERFFISCLSGLAGATSVVVTEDGAGSTWPWPQRQCIYAVEPDGPDCLWLAGGSDKSFVRLCPSTGQWERFPFEGGRFITAGMALDPDTGKLFCGAQTAMVVFDTRTQRTVRVYGPDEKPPDNFHYDHWRLADGSWGFILETPGLSCLRWDPRAESITWRRLTDDSHHPAIGLVRWLRYVEDGRVYLPHFGWLDGLTGEVTPHEHPPDQEACWLGRRGDVVYGIRTDTLNAIATLVAWDLASGRTAARCTMPDTPIAGCALTASGKLLSVDLYGTLRRHDLSTGALELTRTLISEHEHPCNVIIPAGDGRVIGTPFIAMNFWGFDTAQGKGFYGGRVAGSLGQCDDAVAVGGKMYFSIYGGGQLTEYDPQRQTGFPRNPRMVAQNAQGQHGAGIATDGRVVWVAFWPKYGTLDGAMIRYDTATGEASSRNGAVPDQTILSPMVDSASGNLVAGTTFLSDCSTATPVHDRTAAVVLDPRTMDVLLRVDGPAGVDALRTLGPLDLERWLMQGGRQRFVFDTRRATLTPCEGFHGIPADAAVVYAGRPGCFVLGDGAALRLWDASTDTAETLATLAKGLVRRWWVHGVDLTFDCGRYAILWRDALAQGWP